MRISSMIKLLEYVNGYPLFESTEQYRKLVKVFHPDRGGDPEIFKAITKVEKAGDIKTLQQLVDNIQDVNKVTKYLELNGYLEGKKELSKQKTQLSTEVKEPNFNQAKENKHQQHQDDVLEGELVDEEDAEDTKIKDEREGASEEYKKALENQYGTIQVYKECIMIIVNKRPEQELSKQEKKEILTLLDEWEKECTKYNDEDYPKLKIQSEIESYAKLVHNIKLEIKYLRTKLEHMKSVYKTDVFKVIDKTWASFTNILNAKLPKGVIQTIMYSNPFTALIAENWDIVSGITKATYDTIKDKVQKNNKIKK